MYYILSFTKLNKEGFIMNKTLTTIKGANLKARKAKNRIVSNVLTTLIGEIEIVGKNDGNRETTESETIAVINKFKKNALETVNNMKERGISEDEIQKYVDEVDLYSSYLPTLLSETELTDIIKSIIGDGEVNIGKIMGTLKKLYRTFK